MTRLHRTFNTDQDAVSPVLAVLTMVAVTLLLGGAFYAMTLIPDHQTGYQTPRAGATTEPAQYGFRLNIIDIDIEVEASLVNYWLKDAGGGLVEEGCLAEIPGLLIEDDGVNITYQDVDQDRQLSSGDEILLKDLNHGGPAIKGYSLRLSFVHTGGTIVEKTF